MSEDRDFVCCKCKKHLNESFSFSGYGPEKAKQEKMRNRNYCEEHFDVRYKEIFGKEPMGARCEEDKGI